MEKINENIIVEGNGKNKKEAVMDGVSKIREVVIKKYPDLLIFHILPEDIKILSSEQTDKNFLKGELHQVKLSIKIEIKAMKID